MPADPVSEIFVWAAATLGIGFYVLAAFSALCYLLLPIYLMFRLGRNAELAKRRHKEVIHMLRSLRS